MGGGGVFNLCMVCEVNDGRNLNRAYNSNEKTGVYSAIQ